MANNQPSAENQPVAKPADAPKNAETKSDSTDNIDRTQLYNDYKGMRSEQSKSNDQSAPGAKPPEPEHLVMKDPFKPSEPSEPIGDGDNYLARSRGRKPASAPESAANAPSFKVMNDQSKFDPKKPTVAFLDDFNSKPEILLNGKNNGFNHGEFSARSAESQGFNALRLDLNVNGIMDKQGHWDFGKALRDIEKGIDDGSVKLGKGDVINVSAGNEGPTFKEMGQMLGMKVTPENLAEMRPKILKEIGRMSEDKSLPKDLRGEFKRMKESNEAIERLQARGIEVVNASGNSGKEFFNTDFLAAKHQLAGVRADGTPHPASARHSLTVDTPFTQKINYERSDPFFNATPIADQKGQFRIANTEARFPATDFGGADPKPNANTLIDQKDERFGLKKQPNLTRDMLSKEATPSTFEKTPPAPEGSHVTLLKGKRTPIIEESKKNKRTDIPDMIEAAQGTSFGNINFLPTQLERLTKLKQGY